MGDSDNESGEGGKVSGNNRSGSNNELRGCREQDRYLPIANVSRIMKKSLPANAKISKEAKETVQECVSEFISFITGEASDKCQKEKRKTINGDDLLWAMTTLGFEGYVDPLKVYLQKYRDMEGDKSGFMGGSGMQQGDHRDDGGGGYGHGHGHGQGQGNMMPYPMMMIMGHQHQGHMYGSGTGSPSSRRTR